MADPAALFQALLNQGQASAPAPISEAQRKEAILRAAIKGFGKLASTPGNFLQGATAGIDAGTDAFFDTRDQMRGDNRQAGDDQRKRARGLFRDALGLKSDQRADRASDRADRAEDRLAKNATTYGSVGERARRRAEIDLEKLINQRRKDLGLTGTDALLLSEEDRVRLKEELKTYEVNTRARLGLNNQAIAPPAATTSETDTSGMLSGPAGTREDPVHPQTLEDLNNLPPGTIFINPSDGKPYRKN